MADHCCDDMRHQLAWYCDKHSNPYECMDCLILYSKKDKEYGLVIHNKGGGSVWTISYCPWCGQRLPGSKRERGRRLWLDEL